MRPRAKTIQIFLPSGDPQGIRIAEITTRILQVIEVPRSLLSDFLKMPESEQVALYFLVGGSADGDDPQVYVGQTGDLRSRLPSHNKTKDFWERALIVISRTNSLTQTHALFLEWHCIQAVREAGRYSDHNGNSGSRPHTPAPLEADCLEVFDTVSTLLATLAHPLFVPFVKKADVQDEDELFFCTGSDADAKGTYTQEGFVVFKGSSGRVKNVPSMKKWSLDKSRQKLLDLGVLLEQDGRLVFQKDHLFGSPSMAAIAVMGRNANGWTEWKNKDGQTLDEVKRQPVDSQGSN
jgi:hypothetical protein